DADGIIVGVGLAGLLVAAELTGAGRRVILLDQESEANLGGQAYWSFGGLLMVDTPEQRRLGIRDSRELAGQDWLGTAGFDRPEDFWPRRWADRYLDFAAGEMSPWLRARGLSFFPLVQWAERGGGTASGPGNSVPRCHVTWGIGTGVVAPFVRQARQAQERGLLRLLCRHRVTGLSVTAGAADGVSGEVLEPDVAPRGERSSRVVVSDFSLSAPCVIVTSGGIGGNHDLVRRYWPARLGAPPARLLSGVPDYVDGRMQELVAEAGAHLINQDRMWHYPEGLHNFAPVWSHHGIRVLSGPSPLWLDACGERLPAPLFPGFDALGALEGITRKGDSHSWFLLNHRIIAREFTLSGSEQNPDLTTRDPRLLMGRLRPGPTPPVRAFLERGQDFVVRGTLPALVGGMNELVGEPLIDAARLEELVLARDRDALHPYGKDAQLTAIRGARRYPGDRLTRLAKPHA
ncbi:MAG: FAD-binding dehydrogenase, partial [Deinococcus sp.]